MTSRDLRRIALVSALPLLGACFGYLTPSWTSPASEDPGLPLFVTRVPSATSDQVVLMVQADVRNTSDSMMNSEGPAAGYVYRVGETYLSPDHPLQAGDWRLAVGPSTLSADELPYRWGLGGPLAPGAARRIVGGLTLPATASEPHLTAALVRETERQNHIAWRWALMRAYGAQVAVVVDVADARSAPTPDASVVGSLRYRTQLQTLNATDGWLEVRLPSGLRGWLPSATVANLDGW